MGFESAVKAAPALSGHYRPGLQGLRNVDRRRIHTERPRQIRGSIDLDSALRPSQPNQPIWDYCVGLSKNRDEDRALWLEVHPASSRHVDEVLKKWRWLRRWLPEQAPALDRMSAHYIWLASGSVALPANSPQRRRIAQSGILLRSGLLNLDQLSEWNSGLDTDSERARHGP